MVVWYHVSSTKRCNTLQHEMTAGKVDQTNVPEYAKKIVVKYAKRMVEVPVDCIIDIDVFYDMRWLHELVDILREVKESIETAKRRARIPFIALYDMAVNIAKRIKLATAIARANLKRAAKLPPKTVAFLESVMGLYARLHLEYFAFEPERPKWRQVIARVVSNEEDARRLDGLSDAMKIIQTELARFGSGDGSPRVQESIGLYASRGQLLASFAQEIVDRLLQHIMQRAVSEILINFSACCLIAEALTCMLIQTNNISFGDVLHLLADIEKGWSMQSADVSAIIREATAQLDNDRTESVSTLVSVILKDVEMNGNDSAKKAARAVLQDMTKEDLITAIVRYGVVLGRKEGDNGNTLCRNRQMYAA